MIFGHWNEEIQTRARSSESEMGESEREAFVGLHIWAPFMR